jgi:hypothetical protein
MPIAVVFELVPDTNMRVFLWINKAAKIDTRQMIEKNVNLQPGASEAAHWLTSGQVCR